MRKWNGTPSRPPNIGTATPSNPHEAPIVAAGNQRWHSRVFPRGADNCRQRSRKDFCPLDIWNKRTLISLAFPAGVLLLAAVILLGTGVVPLSASVIDFYYYAVFLSGILLAWRFHSTRVLFALIILLLAHRSLAFFAAGSVSSAGPGHIALEAIAFLLPVNFVILSVVSERGLVLPSIAFHLCLLFLEAVFVAIICRPGQTIGPAFLHSAFLGRDLFRWTIIPPAALLPFAAAFLILLTRFLLFRKPVESGLLWSLAATFLALHAGGLGPSSAAYIATGGLILVSSIIENSYHLAYHDELTGLPARRGFNEALLGLEEPYVLAAVDIDHFKNFNDTFGHDTGDEVLRMVASRLARVTGGGQAFRVGGEEFSVLFPGKALAETLPHLESLRADIEASTFRPRGGTERRVTPRGPDRRNVRRKNIRPRVTPAQTDCLSVTVSIGAAAPTVRAQLVEQVIKSADKALYRAKQSGRNRVEVATAGVRASRLKGSLA
jgi:diguanylate cyclase (GGDEF)-like protein